MAEYPPISPKKRTGLQQDCAQWDARGKPTSALTGQLIPIDRAAVFTNFLAPTISPARWSKQDLWQVIELGFGAGINFLETVLAWRASSARLPAAQRMRARLSYVAVDRSPLPAADVARLLRQAGYSAPEYQPLIEQWPDLIRGFHRLSLGNRIELTLAFGEPATLLPEMTGRVDAIYLNRPPGASPDRTEPALDKAVLNALWRRCSPLCRIAGDFPLGSLGDALTATGFAVSQNQQRWSGALARHPSRLPPLETTSADRSVAVLGAGIAGLVMAQHLCSKGWGVTLIEAADQAIAGGSGQPILAGHLHLSPDENYLTRLTRSAQRFLQTLPGARRTGRLHLAHDRQDVARQIELLERLGWPASLLTRLNPDEAGDAAGIALKAGGIWQPGSLTLDPASLLKALPQSVRLMFGSTASGLRRHAEKWQVLDTAGSPIALVDKVIVCTAHWPGALIPGSAVRTEAIVGQSTKLSDPRAASLRCVLGGAAYACPLPDGSVLTGATYREPPLYTEPADDLRNRGQWEALLAAPGMAQIMASYAGLRHTTADRLPLIGPAPDETAAREQQDLLHRDDRLPLPSLPGIYFAGGFGSRGALWSALAARVIADQLDQTCLPIENSLAEAITPQRFVRRAIRHRQLC